MSKIRVGVLRGGPSSEYEVSLKTGHTILQSLQDQYEPHDIFIDRTGAWHHGGVAIQPPEALKRVDVIFNALHGEYGEDGKVQRLLETFGVPYTGSASLPSAIAMNKAMTKESLKDLPIRMARHVVIDAEENPNVEDQIIYIFRTFPQPSVVKPMSLGSSVGVTIARSFPSFFEAVQSALKLSNKVMVEEYIPGREATCGVVDNFRGSTLYALFPIEITPPKDTDFYDYDAKYQSEDTRYICPGNFSHAEKQEMQEMAKQVHAALGLRHYSRSDFIVHPRRGIYFLEVNTLPGMTDHSLVPKALGAAGCSLPDFIHHVLTLALENR